MACVYLQAAQRAKRCTKGGTGCTHACSVQIIMYRVLHCISLCMSTAARGSGGISLQAGHQSSGGACSAHGARSILCDRSVLANLRRADGFGGGLVGCQLLSLEQHRSVVLPQVSAGSVDRSCWRASVRFSVSLRVGSSGLLGDLAGDPGLHPADERDKVRLATKTLGAAWWRAASRITALSHIGRSACGLAIVFVLVPVTSAAGRGYRWWTNLLGLL